MGVGKHRLFEAELFERAKDVGAELDAGRDLVESGACSSTRTAKPLRRERVRRCQAAVRRRIRSAGLDRRTSALTTSGYRPRVSEPLSQQLNCVPYASRRPDEVHSKAIL